MSTQASVAAALAAGALLWSPLGKPAQAQTTQPRTAPSGRMDSQVLAAGTTGTAEYQTLYVNPAIGDDSSPGAENQPLKTVTRALELAPPNTVIVLAPGRYTQTTGEVFPLQLKSGVTIQGTPGTRDRTAIIEGGGNFESPSRAQQNVAIVAADRAGIAQVAISNPNGYGVWIESANPTILETAFVGNRQTGIYIAGGSPRVQGSYFSGNQVAGLIVFGASRANIQGNTFDGTGDAIRAVDGATPDIISNRMTNNDAGLVVVGNANPVLRNNQMVGNRRNDVVAVAASSQDIEPPTTLPLEASAIETPTVAETTAVPEAADAIPGERGSSFTLQPLQPTVQMAANQGIEADAVPGLLSPRIPSPVSERAADLDPVIPQAAVEPVAVEPVAVEPAARPRPLGIAARQSAEPVADQPTEPATEIAVIAAREPAVSEPAVSEPISASSEQPGLEADAIPGNDPALSPRPAGAPGAALQALQSGTPMASRAVTDGNPSSIRRRRRRPANDNPPAATPAPPINNNRLAVPNSEIPIGSGGSSVIFAAPSSGVGAPPAPPSRAQAMGLYYRVFVEAADPFVQDEVRAVVPDAFRTNFEGQTVMQVGAFPTEDEAEDRRRILEDNDLNVRVEYIR